jgi:hypothetical protein
VCGIEGDFLRGRAKKGIATGTSKQVASEYFQLRVFYLSSHYTCRKSRKNKRKSTRHHPTYEKKVAESNSEAFKGKWEWHCSPRRRFNMEMHELEMSHSLLLGPEHWL